MADGPPAIVAGITRAMKHLAARQQVIAQNIANSETPGYKARDLAAPDFADLLAGTTTGSTAQIARPHVTPSAAMTALGTRGSLAGGTMLDRDVSETKPDGNNVTLEDQMLKMGRVQADFAAMTNLYRKQQALLKTALGKGG